MEINPFEGLPDDLDLVGLSRKEGGDGLGLASDPELLVHLVNGARRRFLVEGTETALKDWALLVSEYQRGSKSEGLEDPGSAEWFGQSIVELAWASSLLGVVIRGTWLDAAYAIVREALPEPRRNELTERFEFVWKEAELRRARGM